MYARLIIILVVNSCYQGYDERILHFIRPSQQIMLWCTSFTNLFSENFLRCGSTNIVKNSSPGLFQQEDIPCKVPIHTSDIILDQRILESLSIKAQFYFEYIIMTSLLLGLFGAWHRSSGGRLKLMQ